MKTYTLKVLALTAAMLLLGCYAFVRACDGRGRRWE